MHPKLQPKLDALEQRTDRLLDRISAMTPAQRTFHPAPGAWSAVQVAEHLARTEETILAALDKGLPEARRKRKLRHLLAAPLVIAAMRVPIKVKAPIREVLPREEEPTFDEVKTDWEEARAAFRQQLEEVDDPDEPLILHPVAGPSGGALLLTFLDAHVHHHEFQIDRLVKHREFPAGDTR